MRLTVLCKAIALLASFYASSQDAVVDSLYKALENTVEDTSRINLLLDISNEFDIKDEEGFKVVREAFELSKSVDSEKSKARSEAALALYYIDVDLDSGMILLTRAIERYEQLGLVNKISDVYWNVSSVFEGHNDYDSAIYFLEKSLKLAEKNNYPEGIANANYSLSDIHSIRGKNSLALKHSLAAQEFYKKAGMEEKIGQTHNLIGTIYDYMGLYPQAVENYLIAKDISLETKDVEGEIGIINNLGVIYHSMGDSKSALKYFNEALEKSGILGNKENEATLLNNLSYIYLEEGDTLKALSSLWKALGILKEGDRSCLDIYPMEGLGSIYIAKRELDSASYYLHSTLDKGIDCQDVGILTTVHLGLGRLYELQGQYRKALRSLNRSLKLSKAADLAPDIQSSLFELYRFHKKRGDDSKAIGYLESYQLMIDSVHKVKNIEKATQLALEYKFRKQVDAIEAIQIAAENAYNEELNISNLEKRYILFALILLALLVLTLGRFYYLIQKQNKKLKWLNEEKNTLMGVVAHDLRNPLNMIKGLMQLIVGVKTNSETENSEQYLHLIRMSTQRMSDMIDKVLDISAIENMKVNLSLMKEDLTQLLSRTTENFRHIAERKEIKIRNNFDENSQHLSNVDANYFDQIMDNLLSNALKFSNPGTSVYIDIKLEDGNQIVSVKDEGPGLSAEEVEALFKKFKTLTPKPTSNEQSTGLGLSIVKKFVKAMGGAISCESELGKGTTFFLTFKEA